EGPGASRRHALVRLTGEGAEVVPLGRSAVELCGKAVTRPQRLAHGDVLGVPGLEVAVELEAAPPEASTSAARYVLERANGTSFGITHTPFVLGGGAHDDLIIKSWPPRALVLHVAQ